jgi:hypothetical protein
VPPEQLDTVLGLGLGLVGVLLLGLGLGLVGVLLLDPHAAVINNIGSANRNATSGRLGFVITKALHNLVELILIAKLAVRNWHPFIHQTLPITHGQIS